MAESKQKGDLAESKIMADLLLQGYKICVPFGEDQPFDLLVYKENKNQFYRVQCKYSNHLNYVNVRIRTNNDRIQKVYTAKMVDFIAVYDAKTDNCYYVSSSEFDGYKATLTLRHISKNNQIEYVHWAKDYRLIKI